jgi:hypothetical protein
MNRKLFLIFLLPAFLFCACKEDDSDKTGLINGLWQQEKITEEDVEINLSADRKNICLLFESNGVYRTYAKDRSADKEHFGAWSITDNQWLEITADTWRLNSDPVAQNPSNQWVKNHIPVRFTILKLSDNELEIRMKTFIGEQKYAALFTEDTRPPITSENLETIQQEFMTQKTYIYTFKKVNN